MTQFHLRLFHNNIDEVPKTSCLYPLVLGKIGFVIQGEEKVGLKLLVWKII